MSERIVRVDVDTQHGFCDPLGGLYVQKAERVIELVAELNRDAEARRIPLVGSVDTHESYSREFKENGGVWPVHCVKGTWDWLKEPKTLPKRFVIVAAARYERPLDPSESAIYFEKDVYSLFDNPNAEPVIRRLATPETTFQVYGVATDFCVKAAATGLRERFPQSRVQVLTDAIAAVTAEGGAQALKAMKDAGIDWVTSVQALKR